MPTLSSTAAGLTYLLIGALFFAGALVFLRLVPRLQPLTRRKPRPPLPIQLAQHKDAILVVQTGGRVAYLNQLAREWFNVWEDEPNLERMARRARPGEAFLSLCASESQTRLAIDGRAVEATSYFTPYEGSSAMLVSLRQSQWLVAGEAEAAGHPAAASGGQALGVLTELSQAITVSLDLEKTLEAVLDRVDRLIPSDVSEINLWDGDNRCLIPYRFVGLAGLDRHLEKSTDRYVLGQGFTGYLAEHRRPLLVADVNTFREIRPAVDRKIIPFNSYLGVPLLMAGELIGTLELGSLAKDNFSQADLEGLRLLAGQAAVAIHNALLYQTEQSRMRELAGLAQLAQAVSSLRDRQDLFSQLTANIAPLLQVEVLGFLLYNENRRTLEGQTPFAGLPDNVVEWCQVLLPPDSPAEAIWQSGETLITADARHDERIAALGLHHVAVAAGIRQTALIPLVSGGRRLGYMQAANKEDGSPFAQDDLRLLSIIAAQIAPLLDNASLVQQAQQRAKRSETMRRIASLTASTATLDEILQYSLLDLARLLQAEVALIFLLDQTRGELRLHKPSLFGVNADAIGRFARLPVEDPHFAETVTSSQRQLTAGDLRLAELPSIYRSLLDGLQVLSVIALPLISRDRGIGEIILGSRKADFFTQNDMLSAATAGSQVAIAIEQSALSSQTDQTLRQRVDQLMALARISREINTTLDLRHLLQRVFDEILRTTQADCGVILLYDLAVDPHNTRRIFLSLGDDTDLEADLLERCVLDSGEAIIIPDFEALAPDDERLPEGLRRSLAGGHPLSPPHATVRSALVVPIAYQGQTAGLIYLHAAAPDRFGPAALEISETLAVQAAIALGNALRYQEQVQRSELLNRRVETLSRLLETTQILQAEQPLEESLEAIAYAIQAATPFDVVLISAYDPHSSQLQRLACAGLPLATMAELRARPQPWTHAERLLHPEFRLGRVYFIPHEKRPVIPAEVHMVTVLDQEPDDSPGDRWHPHDLLLMPLYDTGGDPLGLISVDAPRDNLRPDRPALESLEIFGSQAAIAIENQRKLGALKTELAGLREHLEDAQASAELAQRHLPSLLHKDLENTLAIQRLSQRARRIQAGLDIAEIVNRKASRLEVLEALAQEILTRMELEVALVAEPGVPTVIRATPVGTGALSGLPRLLQALGNVPEGANPEALLGQRSPLRQSLQTGAILLVSDLAEAPEWQVSPLLYTLEAKSFICLPIVIDNQVDSAVLAVSRASLPPFGPEDEQLFSLLARQVSTALQNLKLMEETRRRLREVNLLLEFSRHLGALEHGNILKTLVDSAVRAVPNADAAMVALWDPRGEVLVPQAAQGYPNLARLMEMTFSPGEGLPGQAFQEGKPLRIDEVNFVRHYNLSAENQLRYRDATAGRPPVSSLVIPIVGALALKAGSSRPEAGETPGGPDAGGPVAPLGVLILDNFSTPSSFSEDDLALISSLTQQTALTLENAGLYQASERRARQMEALTEVAATITGSLEPQELISSLLDQLEMILPYNTGTLWLRQKGGEAAPGTMVVRAARGFADSDLRIGLSVSVEDSLLLNEMIDTGRPISVADVRQDPRFPSIMEYEHLSWLGIPLIASGEVIGVIALEKTEPGFYTAEHIQMATTFAGQAAVGLENASLYQEIVSRAEELDQQSRTLVMLNRLSTELSGSLDPQHILGFAIRELHNTLSCSSVSALLFAPDGAAWLVAEFPQLEEAASRPALPERLPHAPLFDHLRESRGIFQSEAVDREEELAPLAGLFARHRSCSLLALPLATGSTLHGLILAHTQSPHRFEVDEVELARTISNQVAVAVQNATLFAETRSLTEDLERRVDERTTELAREHQRTQTLLQVITELSASLDLEQVLNRTLRVLNDMIGAEQITVLIVRPGEKKLHMIASIGYASPDIEPGGATTLDVDQGLAGWVIRNRTSVIIDDVRSDPRWVTLTNGAVTDHRSALGVPLMVGPEALGCMLLFHRRVAHFSQAQLEMLQAAGNQVAVAVNNAELYRLIRDQAEDLGAMLRSQQVETSRSKAILEAVADGVLVTDATRTITLFNASAEKILGLNRSQVIGKSLEHFTGLFGKAAQSWRETIQTWSQDPNTYQPGATFTEQLTLENGKVVSIRLSPVILRRDFLGTVSIFSDITHQVEVDRLKSEFVATVSHELRTPMTSIKGYVEILLMGAAGALNEQQRHFLDTVRINTERLAVLVNDLLDISRIEAGKVRLNMQPLNLAELATELVANLKRRSDEEGKQIKIEVLAPPDLPPIYGDMERVRQILENLLDNAYLYNYEDGSITLNMQQVGDEIQVDVKDTGFGIPIKEQPRIFERFFRGEGPLVLGVAGTGLGLSIVQNLINMHHGRIWLESSGIPREGSTFSITLPVYQMEQ